MANFQKLNPMHHAQARFFSDTKYNCKPKTQMQYIYIYIQNLLWFVVGYDFYPTSCVVSRFFLSHVTTSFFSLHNFSVIFRSMQKFLPSFQQYCVIIHCDIIAVVYEKFIPWVMSIHVMIKQWIVIFRKMQPYNCDGVCIQTEYTVVVAVLCQRQRVMKICLHRSLQL